MDKPDGFRVIRPEEVQRVLAPLPVSSIFGVGPRTPNGSDARHCTPSGDLAARDRDDVLRRFGASGAWIHDLAHGIDVRRVSPRRERRSYSQERTFPKDIDNREELRARCWSSAGRSRRLRDAGLRAAARSRSRRYSNFKTLTRTQTLPFSTNVGIRFYAAARYAARASAQGTVAPARPGVAPRRRALAPGQPLRGDPDALAAPEAAGGRTNRGGQLRDRLESMQPGLDRLRRKYGRTTVLPATLLGRAESVGRDGTGASAGARVRDLDA